MTNTRHPLRCLAALLLCLALLLTCASAAFAEGGPEYASREYVVSQFVQSVGRGMMGTSDYLLSTFSDWEDIGAEYRDDLSRAVNAGVLRGYSGGTLRPAEPIRRVEALVMFSRILPELEAVREPIAFSDVPGWAREEIDRLSAAGLVEGCGDGTLGSYDLITVEQVGLLTDRSDALLNRWTPGENFYAYVNDKAFRNYIPGTPTVDAAHGVITHEDTVYSGFELLHDEIDAQEDALLRALGSGELAYENGSPAQRLYDFYDCIIHQEEDHAAMREWFGTWSALLLEAETPAAFMEAWAAVFRETRAKALFSPDAKINTSESVIYPKLSIIGSTPAAMLAFDAETEPKYRDTLIEALTAFGETLDGDLTAADAEAAYELQKTLGAGTNYIGEYEDWLYAMLDAGRLPEGTDAQAVEARLAAIRAQHPELCGEDADTQEHLLTLEEAAAITDDPLLDVPTILRSVGFHDFEGVFISEPTVGVIKSLHITEENLGAWKLTAVLAMCSDLREAASDAQWDAAIYCLYCGYGGMLDGAYPFERYDAWFRSLDEIDTEVDYVSGLRYFCGLWLPEDIGALWYEHYCDPAISGEVLPMIEDLLQAYRTRFAALEWMDDETRAAAMRKLDNIVINIGWEEDAPEILSRAEGGTMLSNCTAINAFLLRKHIRMCADSNVFRHSHQQSADTVNAYYTPSFNSIEIPPAILLPPIYSPGGDYAANLGRLGSMLGHEIGHAFDRLGAQKNEVGAEENWWSEETATVYETLAERFLTYYGNYEITDGVQQDPSQIADESMADFAGMTAVMELLKDDPEAQRAALEAFAEVWFEVGPVDEIVDEYLYDRHPFNCIRVNAIVSSLDAFYELYDVGEDDPMYVAPEDRLELW